MTSSRSLFFNLLGAINHIESQHTEQLPDLDAQVLLIRIAMAHDKKIPMNVTQAMNLDHIGSPAMLHRKINDLLNQGLIELTFEGNNRRTKFLVPTAQAYAIIDELADAAASVYDTVS